jgi:hypothetical protein
MKLFNRLNRHIRSRDRKRPAFHLNFELCEDRVLLAIPILVTTTADNGNNLNPTPGSLRQAILTANSTPGPNTIDFNIRGPGPIIIQPATALPTITNQVNLDGTTERTFLGLPAAGPPVVQINGNGLKGDGLVLGSGPPPVNQAPAITSLDNTTFTLGAAGTFKVTTTGTPTAALSETGTLPSGVTFVDNGDGTATLAGTPAAGTAAGSPYTLMITANNGVTPNATQTFTLTVS